MSPFDRQAGVAEAIGALDALDPRPRHPADRWGEARSLLDLDGLTDEEVSAIAGRYEDAYRASSGAIRLATVPRPRRDETTTVEPLCVVPIAGPPVRRTRRPLWRRLLGLALLSLAGCSGAVETPSTPRDAGAADLAPQTGCYGDAQLACGPTVGRWCWASPSSAVPDGCVPFAPDAAVTPFGYTCCT